MKSNRATSQAQTKTTVGHGMVGKEVVEIHLLIRTHPLTWQGRGQRTALLGDGVLRPYLQMAQLGGLVPRSLRCFPGQSWSSI